MRKRLAKLPSPAMAVAFLALMAALAGTATALPGSNIVSGGDIINGAVKSADIRNSTIRGGDVRNNTLTGNDINEGSLGQVASANRANSANAASFAAFSGLSAETARLRHWNTSLAEGDAATVFSLGGILLEASCDDNAGDTELTYTLTGPSNFAGAGDDDSETDGTDVIIEDPGSDDTAGGDADISDGYDDPFNARIFAGLGLTGMASSTADADDEVCTAWGHVVIR